MIDFTATLNTVFSTVCSDCRNDCRWVGQSFQSSAASS